MEDDIRRGEGGAVVAGGEEGAQGAGGAGGVLEVQEVMEMQGKQHAEIFVVISLVFLRSCC